MLNPAKSHDNNDGDEREKSPLPLANRFQHREEKGRCYGSDFQSERADSKETAFWGRGVSESSSFRLLRGGHEAKRNLWKNAQYKDQKYHDHDRHQRKF